MTKKSDEDSIHPSETAYDKAIKRMEEREAHIFNTPAMQIAADAAEQIRIQQAPLIQALQPLQDALQPYHNLIDQNSLGLVAASLSSVAQTIVPDNAVGSMTESLNVVATAIQPYQQDKALENMAVIIICAILVAAVLGALGRELKIHIDLLKPKSNEPHQNDDSDISTSWEDR